MLKVNLIISRAAPFRTTHHLLRATAAVEALHAAAAVVVQHVVPHIRTSLLLYGKADSICRSIIFSCAFAQAKDFRHVL